MKREAPRLARHPGRGDECEATRLATEENRPRTGPERPHAGQHEPGRRLLAVARAEKHARRLVEGREIGMLHRRVILGAHGLSARS